MNTQRITIPYSYCCFIESSNSSVATFQILGDLPRKSPIYAYYLGNRLIPGVLYTLEANNVAVIYCLSKLNILIEIKGNINNVTVEKDFDYFQLLNIVSVLKKQRLRAHSKICDIISQVDFKKLFLRRECFIDKESISLNYLEYLKSLFVLRQNNNSIKIPKILIVGPSSRTVAQSIVCFSLQGGNFPLYIDLNPSSGHYDSIIDSSYPIDSMLFPPQSIGAVNATSNTYFSTRIYKSHNVKENFVDKPPPKGIVCSTKSIGSLLMDNSNFHSLVTNKMISSEKSELSRLCFYFGYLSPYNNLNLYIHYVRIIAALLSIHIFNTFDTFYKDCILEKSQKYSSILETISSGYVIHGSPCCIESFSLLNEIINIFQVNAVIILNDDFSLAQQFSDMYHYNYIHANSYKIDVTNVAIIPIKKFKNPVSPINNDDKNKINWQDYFFGPSDSIVSTKHMPRNRLLIPVELNDILLSNLRFVEISLDDSTNSLVTYHNVNFECISKKKILEKKTPDLLIDRTVGIIKANSLEECSYRPVIGYLMIKSAKYSTEKAEWLLTVLSPVPIDSKFFKKIFLLVPLENENNYIN